MTRWWLIGGGALLGVLLIGSVALALLSGETEFAPGTPERAVQDLLRAAEDDDIETVYAMLSQELRQRCELKNYAVGRVRELEIFATLRDAKIVDGTTFVNVRITEFYGGGPFGSGESSHDQRFALRQEAGEWKFTEYPWPYAYCRESDDE